MATSNDHNALLDQLQGQVNLILEQTGRVFAALATNSAERPAAQLTKLKMSMPVATNVFHTALDQLEDELQFATLVMRRDLAVCRERAGILAIPNEPQPAAQLDTPPAVEDANQATAQLEPDTKPNETPEADVKTATEDNDVTMTDWLETSAAENPASDSNKPTETVEFKSQPSSPAMVDSKPSIAAHSLLTHTGIAPPTNTLHIDTTNQARQLSSLENKDSSAPCDDNDDDEKVPDTANDLDSLFNDPTSAGGEPDPTTISKTNTNDFSFDDTTGTDMVDFTTFNSAFDNDTTNAEENDNISSLLPGLEDYANTQPGGSTTGIGADLDFNSLFNVTGMGNVSDDPMNSQGAGEQRDTTFDDLLADFDGAGMDGGDGTGGENGGDAFDFDSLFN